MSGLQIPGRMQVNIREMDSKAAFPQSFVLQADPMRLDMNIVGGLSALEYAAIQIAAGGNMPIEAAVERAIAVLNECRRVSQQ